MSMTTKTDNHNANVQYMIDNASTAKVRNGVKYSFSPRKSVQHWSNIDGTGDMWLTDNLITEEIRTMIEAVATITDSPYKKTEKKLILKDDTSKNRVKLFKEIIKACGGSF